MLALEISYLRGARGITRWKGESNNSVYEIYGTETCANGVVGFSGMGERKNFEVVWLYGEKEE